MVYPFWLAALASTASARSLLLPPILQQDPSYQHDPSPLKQDDDELFHFPTVHESAAMGRRIMHLSSLSTLVTTFPVNTTTTMSPSSSDSSDFTSQELSAWQSRPADLAGSPIGLMEYYSDCEPDTGNPTLLAIDIATPYRNFAQGSNISMEIRWWPRQSTHYASSSIPADDGEEDVPVKNREDDDIPTPHTPAALPRFSLHGYLEPIPAADLATHLVPACFMRSHPDSALWQPGNDIHSSQYVRFVVEHVYWFGGFGDRARIQWLPVEEWRGVTREEVEECRLPGE
ncbi:hypothetical protein KC363_g8526 [Hortaea werneckii]|uniref:CREG-like beta-barrel domain-containing protein n=1 Tax=Hortaea werneckii TaxID=91943 RepID=A0A3M7EVJ0_HORWE|nr:hypothetical protein KC325_g8706 [Hortaea werneckii]KAI6997174.1 hypothetical protein KC359_g3045 [Hortaea werneckii]KAI7140524.1 hypothetical protein KC344_g8656 [Hortaea werneckii]KAI7167454.1 hypothetical protein KC360_g8644 [Hortaea werneckii]KAI7182922.1 hypothetical protein KC363_g8526 [Hortaea werneckii]